MTSTGALDTDFEYEGADLEAMSHAHRYSQWIADEMEPYLGERVLEVGAGIGFFSEFLLARGLDIWSAVEPSSRMYDHLTARVDTNRLRYPETIQTAAMSTLADAPPAIATAQFDSVVYMNVLEHIEDDRNELELARERLVEGGHFLAYVPALPALYGPFDKRFGHFRRYTKSVLRELALDAGFDIEHLAYRDFVGTAPWWFRSKILKTDSLHPVAVQLYDRLIPIVKAIDKLTGPPIGKNLVLAARKRS